MKSLRLLNIEDSKTDASALLNHLMNADFIVRSERIETADEMKNALAERKWDVIVSKYQMPCFSGLEAFDILRESGLDIPFVVISETISKAAADKLAAAGIKNYAAKDNLIELVSAVDREFQAVFRNKSHRLLEKKLVESEKRLDFVLSSTGIGTWEINLQNNKIECSNECFEILQNPEFSGKLKDFKALIHPEDVESVWNKIRNAIDAREVYTVEFRIINSRGEILWLSQRGVTEYDADGKASRIAGIIVDITARKKLEQNLRASETRFRTLSENTIAGVALCDESGELLYVNSAYLQIVGYTREEFERGKLNWHELTAPEFDALDRRAIAQARVRGISEQYEKEYIRKDGSRVPVLLGIALSEIEGGEHFISAILDITKRKQAEEELRDSEKKFRALTEATTEIVWNDLEEQPHEGFSEWWASLTGQTAEEMKDMGWTDALHPEDKQSVTDEWLTAVKNKIVFNTVYRIRAVSGEYRFYAVRCVPILNDSGELRQWIGALSDITVRKRAEEKMRQSERRFRSLVTSASQIVWTADSEGVMQTTLLPDGSPFPLKEENIMREWTARLHPEDKDRAIDEFTQALRGNVKFKSEYRLLHLGDNTFHQYISRGTPVYEKDGAVCEWVGTLTDVTDSKIAAEKLRKSEEQLRQGQRLESIGRLAGGIAHDFNNMLTAINGYSDLTLRRLSVDDPLRHNLEEIKKAGENSAALTQQLLAFSRRQMLQPKILDINNVISDTAVMLERLIGENVKLAIALSPDGSRVEADPGQISQVILNLVVNARDAMPNGGTVTIETKNIFLEKEAVNRHDLARAGQYVLLQISDSGIGIDNETLQHIFEPFYTTKEIGKGTGLGLATVYGIVKQTGGYIWVKSEIGRGSTFEVYLPQINEESDDLREQPRVAPLNKGNELILLVEDEETVRNLTRQMLEFCGYKVIAAKDGVEALRICEKMGERINLVLTDVVMPQMGGRDLAKKITENYPRVKILFTSGYTDDSLIRYGKNDENTNFIQKPFTIEGLASKIRTILDS